MSLAMLTRPTATRRRTRKPTVTLSLSIDGVAYRLLPYHFVVDLLDGEVTDLMEHSLEDATGWFQVYSTAPHEHFCQRCEHHGCRHAAALVAVRLLD